jgi:hypothetical protein
MTDVRVVEMLVQGVAQGAKVVQVDGL